MRQEGALRGTQISSAALAEATAKLKTVDDALFAVAEVFFVWAPVRRAKYPARPRPRRYPLAALAAAAAVQTACSFVFIERAPTKHKQMQAFDCTSSVVAPVLDTIWAGLNGLGAAVALGQSDRDYAGRTPDRGTTIGVGLAWLAVSGASAIYGFTQTQTCRRAKEDLYTRLSQQAPPESGPGIAIPASAVTSACQKDTDCKGARICEAGACVDPKPPQ